LNKISLLIPSSQISSGRLDRKSSLKSWNQQIKNAKSEEAHHQHLPPKGAVSFAKSTSLGVVAPFLPAVGKDWSLWGIQSSAERQGRLTGKVCTASGGTNVRLEDESVRAGRSTDELRVWMR
jgi:hypothetical protein